MHAEPLFIVNSKMAASRLHRFRLDGIHDTGIDIGRGSYAVVKEFNFRGLKCVGKEIHSLLYEEAAPRQRADMLRRFEEECELLGRLQHPNVVQFLGVHVGTNSRLPVLVMEYMPATLSGCVDQHGVLPPEISLGIVRDVSLGLRYLHEHSPPIIHRDLSANNVLLTSSLRAKISDLGVAKILDMSPARAARMTQTQVPGTPSYMPPETMIARPKYATKVDIFSMGVLIVHVLSGEWPIPSEAFAEDPLDPDNFKTVSEFDRRRSTIEKIEGRHPLLGLIHQCLRNIPSYRPDAVEVAHHVGEVYSQIPQSPGYRLEAFQQIRSLRAELQHMQSSNDELRMEIETLQTELRCANELLQSERRQKDAVISSLRAETDKMKSHQGAAAESSKSPPCTGLNSCTRLQWKRGADAPKGISGAQAAVMGERVFVGSANKVYEYDWRSNTWSALPDCPVRWFGMTHFLGKVITVGGRDINMQFTVTGKVYQFNELAQQWEEFLTPMPTARFYLTVVTRSSCFPKQPAAIAAFGGCGAHHQALNTVEVYSHASSQWCTAKPLPIPCYWMTSASIDDTCYILGGRESRLTSTKCCFSVSLDSLIDSATSPSSQSDDLIWMSVSDTPLTRSTAANMRGSLIAIGGRNTATDTTVSSVYVLISNGSWERVREGDLPEPCLGSAVVCLPFGELLVSGGGGKKTVFVASVVS